MAAEITVPRLGWSMEEAIFSAWLKGDGEMVHTGDALFAIETDKATQEIESFDAGRLYVPANAPKQGDTVRVGQLIGYLLTKGENAPAEGSAVRGQKSRIGSQPTRVFLTPDPCPLTPSHTTPASTPRARRVAGELGIDWSAVPGTGRGGRIREADVRQASADSSTTRRVMAGRTIASHEKAVPVTLHTIADASALVRLHVDFEQAETTTGVIIPSLEDMLVKLTAAALQQHPALNSRWDGDTLHTSADIHIGIAVDTETGLRIPIIRDAGDRTRRMELRCA